MDSFGGSVSGYTASMSTVRFYEHHTSHVALHKPPYMYNLNILT